MLNIIIELQIDLMKCSFDFDFIGIGFVRKKFF
jgi:hypothetical protein